MRSGVGPLVSSVHSMHSVDMDHTAQHVRDQLDRKPVGNVRGYFAMLNGASKDGLSFETRTGEGTYRHHRQLPVVTGFGSAPPSKNGGVLGGGRRTFGHPSR